MLNIIKLDTARKAKNYILGGKAIVTIVSNKTNLDLVFKIIDAKKDKFWVYIRYEATPKKRKRGPYIYKKEYRGKYIGTIYDNKWFPKKGTLMNTSQRAWAWVWKFLAKDELPKKCCIYHHGTCRRCGRIITAKRSIEKGIGPCCEKIELTNLFDKEV